MKKIIQTAAMFVIPLFTVTIASAQSTDLSTPQFITNKPGYHDYWPGYMADGKSVIFSRMPTGGGYALYRKVLHSDGDATAFLPGFELQATRASVSKSGKIAFTAVGDTTPALYTTDSSGSNIKKVTVHDLPRGAVYPSWMPEDTAVVVVSYQTVRKVDQGGILARINLKTGKSAQLTTLSQIRAGMADVSPDGQRIVFAGQKLARGKPYDQQKNSIWVLGPGDKLHQLVDSQGRAPKWSPDGKWVAYESKAGSSGGQYAIFIVKADGTKKPVQITSFAYNANHPVWSSDGKTMVISAVDPDQPGRTRIALVTMPPLLLTSSTP